MTLEHIEGVTPTLLTQKELDEMIALLVAENEYIKKQFELLFDRQDRVGEAWRKLMMEYISRKEKDQNITNSI